MLRTTQHLFSFCFENSSYPLFYLVMLFLSPLEGENECASTAEREAHYSYLSLRAIARPSRHYRSGVSLTLLVAIPESLCRGSSTHFFTLFITRVPGQSYCRPLLKIPQCSRRLHSHRLWQTGPHGSSNFRECCA